MNNDVRIVAGWAGLLRIGQLLELLYHRTKLVGLWFWLRARGRFWLRARGRAVLAMLDATGLSRLPTRSLGLVSHRWVTSLFGIGGIDWPERLCWAGLASRY